MLHFTFVLCLVAASVAVVHVNADSKTICSLPPETGPCRAAFRRWFYDTDSHSCKTFTYGGCEGNENNFESELSCNDFCNSDDDEEEVADGVLSSIDDDTFKSALDLFRKRSLVGFGRRGNFDCKALDDKCNGVIRCCDTLQCYWAEGYTAFKKGVCVTCIKQKQLCQLDTQCCSGLVCQKGGAGYVDGECDHPRATGGSCHEDDQCKSKQCNISFTQRITFQEGKCA